MTEGFGDGELAAEAGDGQGQQERRVAALNGHPVRPGQGARAHRHQHHHPQHHAFAAVGATRQAAGDGGHGVTQRRTQRGQATHGDEAALQVLTAGPQGNQHTDKPDPDQPPVRGGHALLEHRHREHGDEQRRNEEQRVGGRQRQLAHAEREQRQHGDAEHAAQQVQRPAHLEDGVPGAAPRNVEQHQRHGGHAAQGCDLQHRVVRRQRLEHRVHERKETHGDEHENDAAQVAGREVAGA